MKTVWTITTNAMTGTPDMFGVYENAGAAALAFTHLTQSCNDTNDEYRIKMNVVEEYADLVEQYEASNKRRLEAIAKESVNVND